MNTVPHTSSAPSAPTQGLDWRPVAPGSLPTTARTVLLWTPPRPETCDQPGVFMGWLQGGRLRFCDSRVEADPRHPRAAAWAEMPAGPGSSDSSQAPVLFRWHDASVKQLPEGVRVLILDDEKHERVACLDESGYIIESATGDALDPNAIVCWAFIPAIPAFPDTPQPEESNA